MLTFENKLVACFVALLLSAAPLSSMATNTLTVGDGGNGTAVKYISPDATRSKVGTTEDNTNMGQTRERDNSSRNAGSSSNGSSGTGSNTVNDGINFNFPSR